MAVKKQLLKQFKDWVNKYKQHHPFWVPRTRRTYITDAKRILQTNDLLPGDGYKTVWNHILRLNNPVATSLDSWVRSRFINRKS